MNIPVAPNVPNTIEKALTVNLDPLKYGTLVEIGAGQEVARWFFQAGAAAGTVAKTMSAYDMQFSDEIYGTASDKRYVSRNRLERMLEREFDLLVERVQDHRPAGSQFFAFANTVAAQGYKKRSECHGWMGIRLQLAPDQAPDNIIMHVRMLDDTNVEQQDALGIVGVNLIHGAYTYHHEPERLMRSLLDNLKWGRVQIDLVEFTGPTFGAVDNRLMALELVKASLTPAILFGPDGKLQIPADALYNKSVFGMRGRFNPVLHFDIDRFGHAMGHFLKQPGVKPDCIISLAEITMNEIANTDGVDTSDFLARINELSRRGFHVLVSEFFRYFRVRQYLARYTKKPVGFMTDVIGLGEIFKEEYYDGLNGGILEGLGNLFPPQTTAYVFPVNNEQGEEITIEKMTVDNHLGHLIAFLRDRGQVIAVDDFNVESNDMVFFARRRH